jgi:ABC-type multidrug transport system fused ATPase/permease subunit
MTLARKLLYLLDRRSRIRGAALLLMMLIGAVLEAMGIALVLPFLALVSEPDAIERSDFLQSVSDMFGLSETRDLLILIGSILLALTVLKAFYLTLLYWVQNKFVFGRQAEVSRRLYTAYLFGPYTFHLRRNTAELLRTASFDVLFVFTQILLPLCMILVEAMVVTVVLAVLIVVAPGTTQVALMAIGGLAALSQVLARGKLREFGRRQQATQERMFRWVNEGIGSIKETKVLGSEGFFTEKYGRSGREYARAVRFKHFAADAPRVAIEGLVLSGIFAVVLILLLEGRDLDAVLPTLGLFAIAAVRLMPSASRITTALTAIRFHRVSLDVVYRDLKELERIGSERPVATGERADEGLEFTNDLTLDRVSYRYEGATEPALREISLTIARGESVGFVGPSGAGKTTLIDVLLGLLEPTEGRVLVDGVDVASRLRAWQRRVAYIPQPVFLLDDTILRNVAFGLPHDEIDEARAWKALRSAQLEQFVADLPDRLDTVIGEHGARVSGGQRQRVGIARALYRDAEVLVLDEATAALDYATERELNRSIAGLSGEKTTITIAHRLSTVRGCDRLYFLDSGRIGAVGTYEELLENDDAFRKMALTGGLEPDPSAAEGETLPVMDPAG